MGEAKLRGSEFQRIAQAQAEMNKMRPSLITCERCNHEISEILPVPAEIRHGLEAAFYGECPSCKHSTYLLKGSPKALQAFAERMTAIKGTAPTLGSKRQVKWNGLTEPI